MITTTAPSVTGDRIRGRLEAAPVTSLMNDPVVLHSHQTLFDACELLRSRGERHIVVVDFAGRAMKVLSAGDLVRCCHNQSAGLDTPVIDACGPRRPFVGSSATAAEAASTMALCREDAVGILDAFGHPLGVVTASDILASEIITREPVTTG